MAVIRAVVFDLDDTLYPERAFAYSGFAVVAREFAEPCLGDPARAEGDMRRLFDSEHRRRVFDALLEERGVFSNPDLVARMVETYRTHQPTINPYADARVALLRLRGRVKLGLITDGRAGAQRAKLNALCLGEFFDEIIVTSELDGGADTPSFAKPHPKGFERMAELLRVASNECCYVADNPAKDFVAPNALGWLTIQVRRADGLYRDAVAPPGGTAGRCIDTLDRLDSVLGQGSGQNEQRAKV